jgi:hypothetical protein
MCLLMRLSWKICPRNSCERSTKHRIEATPVSKPGEVTCRTLLHQSRLSDEKWKPIALHGRGELESSNSEVVCLGVLVFVRCIPIPNTLSMLHGDLCRPLTFGREVLRNDQVCSLQQEQLISRELWPRPRARPDTSSPFFFSSCSWIIWVQCLSSKCVPNSSP